MPVQLRICFAQRFYEARNISGLNMN